MKNHDFDKPTDEELRLSNLLEEKTRIIFELESWLKQEAEEHPLPEPSKFYDDWESGYSSCIDGVLVKLKELLEKP